MTTTQELIAELWASDAASGLTNRAARHIESLSAENARLLAANRDCVVHFDTLKADYDKASAQLEAQGEAVGVDIASLVEGMSVSVDVSTGEHDAGNRLFGKVMEVMECQGDKHGVTLLVHDVTPNFSTHPAPAAPVVNGLNIELAARKLAERFDYPWVYMPDKGRETMRQHAQAVLDAALHPTQPKGEKA